MDESVVRGLVVGVFLLIVVAIVNATRKALNSDPERKRRAGIVAKVAGFGLLGLFVIADPRDGPIVAGIVIIGLILRWVFRKPSLRSERRE